MNKKAFYDELMNLIKKHGLCLVPQNNDKYELPLEIVPYNKNVEWLYEDLVGENQEESDVRDEIETIRKSCKRKGILVEVEYVDVNK